MTNLVLDSALEEVLRGAFLNNSRSYAFFHPSDFARCARYIAYRYFNIPSEAEFNPRMQKIWDTGHSMHDRYKNYFRNLKEYDLYGYWRCIKCEHLHGEEQLRGITVPLACEKCKSNKFEYEEILVKNEEYNFRGNVDIVLKHKTEDDWYVVDMKTAKHSTYIRTTTIDPKYRIQLMIYLWLLDIPHGFILYENKDNQENKDFYLQKDPKVIESIKKTAHDLLAILKQKKIPIRKHKSKENFECRYCDYRRRCWKSL